MAQDNPITQGDGTGGVLALLEKTFFGSTKKFQRVILTSGDTLNVATLSGIDTTGTVVSAGGGNRIYVQVRPLDGDVYIADSVAHLANAGTRRKVQVGEAWEHVYYAGDVAVRAVSGTVSIETEQVS